MLALQDYFGRMSSVEAPSAEVVANAADLLEHVNALLDVVAFIPAAQERHVNSGWRSAAYNATVPGAALKSRHITGGAIDIRDSDDGELDAFLFADWEACVHAGRVASCLLARFGLYMEHPAATKGWCHLQRDAPRSGNRVFMP